MDSLEVISAKKDNPKTLFREKPPIDIVNQVLRGMGFDHGLTDSRTFTRECLDDMRTDEWISLLEPYYYPCKARRFLDYCTKDNFITIIRHIIRINNFDLRTQERVIGGVKKTQYRIEPNTPSFKSNGAVFIEFN